MDSHGPQMRKLRQSAANLSLSSLVSGSLFLQHGSGLFLPTALSDFLIAAAVFLS